MTILRSALSILRSALSWFRRRVGWPYLDLWLDLGLIQVQTKLFYERFESREFEYVVLRLTWRHKHGFSIRLYKPFERRFR